MICFLIIFAEACCKSFGICESFNFIINREVFTWLCVAEASFELFLSLYKEYKNEV